MSEPCYVIDRPHQRRATELGRNVSSPTLFAAADLTRARALYHQDVVYLSPTVRLFGWPPRIEGVDKTLEFIQLTIRSCRDIRYEAVESGLPARRAFRLRAHPV
jgi:hypothetical protein